MRTHPRFSYLLSLLLLLTACDDDGAGGTTGDTSDLADAGGDTPLADSGDLGDASDGGADTTSDLSDAAPDTEVGEGDADPDAEPSNCIAAQIVPSWGLEVADDVSVGFNVVISPQVDDTYSELIFLFERYTPGPDIGTFTLGGDGPDGNFGTCAHCVALWDYSNEAYFADRGTLTTNLDPYLRRFDASVTNLRLVEVTLDPETRASTPVPGGSCVEVADFTVSEGFPDETWTCFVDQFADGETCDCECGAIDSDCQHEVCPPNDPECEENRLPVADCEEGEVCGFDPTIFSTACVESCAWEAREGCEAGVCVYEFGVGDGDTCISGADRLDEASIGEDCETGGLQRFCNISEGFALGFCDWNGKCAPICDAQEDCTVEGEQCWFFFGEDGLGWCGTEFEGE